MGRLHHPPRTPRQIHGPRHGQPSIRSLVPRSQRLLARSRPQPSSPRQTTQRQASRTRVDIWGSLCAMPIVPYLVALPLTELIDVGSTYVHADRPSTVWTCKLCQVTQGSLKVEDAALDHLYTHHACMRVTPAISLGTSPATNTDG